MNYIIVDADSILFKAAIVSSNHSEVRSNVKNALKKIQGECFMGEMLIAVKGRGNYRYDVFPEYKGNRKDIDEDIKERINYAHKYIREKFNAVTADGMEADDLVTIWSWECIKNDQPYILAHIDKDLDQVPGLHYNYNRESHYSVSEEEGYRFLCKQWVMGDSTDGIPGLRGWGPKKAENFVKGIRVEDLERRIRSLYKMEGYDDKYCDQMYHMVYMLQEWDELYKHDPSLKPKEDKEETDEDESLEPRDGTETRGELRVHLHGDEPQDKQEIHREEAVQATPESTSTRKEEQEVSD